MGHIYLFAADETDLTTTGICGALPMTSATISMAANSIPSMTADVHYDDENRWAQIENGMLITARMPVRTTPEIEAGAIVTAVEKWTVKTTATKAERTLYTKLTGGKKIAVLPKALAITVVKKPVDAERYKVKAGKYGTGFLDLNAIEFTLSQTLADDPAAIEAVEPAWTIRPQIFRIDSVTRNESALSFTAKHITADLLGNLTTYKVNGTQPAQTVLNALLDNCVSAHDFAAYTNIADTRTGFTWTRLNPIKALLDADDGFVARWDCELVVDNYELFFLNSAGINRGVRIEYGKNLQGISCEVDWSDVVTGIMPAGENADGSDLLLTADGSADIIYSEHAGDYPTPRIVELDCGSEAKVGDGVTVVLARARMAAMVAEQFAAGADQPKVSLSIDFLKLGDLPEYAAYKDLRNERLYLYDYTTISHRGIGISSIAQLASLDFDPVLERFGKVEFGDAAVSMSTLTLSTSQIPGGLNGNKLLVGSVGAGRLGDGAISARHIQADSISAGAIQADAVTATKIAADSIEANKIKASVITADKMVAGTITAASGIIADAAITEAKIGVAAVTAAKIKDGSIENAHIKDATISSAKIVSLNADVIDAGTLSVEHLLIAGPDSIMYEINATSAGLTAAQLTEEQYQNKMSGKVIVAKSITADEIDVVDLFADTATINALKTMTVASLLNGSVLELNELRAVFRTPEFRVEIPGAEEGEVAARFDKDGGYSPNFVSPTVAKRRPGGVYKVYTGLDYDTLADAFADIEGAVLDADMILKVGANDPGGVLRGVRGGRRVIVVAENLIERVAVSANSATLAADGSYGYKVSATTAGTYRYVKILVGRVGDLGLAGKEITISVGTITSVGATATLAVLRLYASDYSTLISDITSVYASDTSRTATIPTDAGDDDVVMLVVYVSQATSCAAGAYEIYDKLHVELGGTMFNDPRGMMQIASFDTVGCDEVNLARINLPNGMRVRDANAVISRSEIYGAVGILAEMCRVRMNNNTGTCTQAVKALCAQVLVTGPAPGGTYDGWLIDTTDATISGSGTAPTTVTKALSAILTGSYVSSGWIADQIIRQGYTTSRGRHYGVMWFDMTQIPSGATVSDMKLTVRRNSTFGVSGAVTIKAYGTADANKSGAPTPITGPYTLGTILKPQTKTFTLPAALVATLADGTHKGIVFYADDTTAISGEAYSANFAGFEGTDATKPVLTVTYTV